MPFRVFWSLLGRPTAKERAVIDCLPMKNKCMWLLGLFVLLFLVQALYLTNFYSKVDDEDLTICAGLNWWHKAAYPAFAGVPPVGPIVLALPSYLIGNFNPLAAKPPLAARAVNIFFALLTLVLLYLLARLLYGEYVAFFPLAVYCLHPQVYASAATTEPATIAACLFVATSMTLHHCRLELSYGRATLLAVLSALLISTSSCATPLLLVVPLCLYEKQKGKPFVIFCILMVLVLLLIHPFEQSLTQPELSGDGKVFLLNERLLSSSFHYLPLLFVFKTPPLFLAILLFLFGTTFLRQSFKAERFYAYGAPLLAACAWLFLSRFAYTDGRAFLPILPLLALVSGGLIEELLVLLPKRALLPTLALTLLMLLGTAYLSFPYGLSYVNSVGQVLGRGSEVLAGANISRGEGQKALEEYARSLPKEQKLYAVPWPLAQPVNGQIAIDRESLVPMYGGGLSVSHWLIPFGTELELGPWKIYRVTKKIMRKRIMDNPRDAAAWYLFAQLLLSQKKLEELADFLPKATVFARRAFIFSAALHLFKGEKTAAFHQLQKIKHIKEDLDEELRLWYEMTESLAGANTLSKEENLMRAVAWSYLLTEPWQRELLKEEKQSPIFKEPIDLVQSHPYLRLIAAAKAMENKNFQRASDLYSSLQYEKFGQAFHYKSYWCKKYNSLIKSQDKRERVRAIMILGHQLKEAKLAWEKLSALIKKDNLDFQAISALEEFRKLRRTILAPFDSGNGTLFDKRDNRGLYPKS